MLQLKMKHCNGSVLKTKKIKQGREIPFVKEIPEVIYATACGYDTWLLPAMSPIGTKWRINLPSWKFSSFQILHVLTFYLQSISLSK